MNDFPEVFKDKNGRPIKAGDVLFRKFFVRKRERPGNKRVAISGMSGEEVIVSDEGKLKEAEEHWVTYRVKWSGACMIAERAEFSDFSAVTADEIFDENGKRISEGSKFHYMNCVFDSRVYEVLNDCGSNSAQR